MKQLISDIVEEFGGREAGSLEEKQAQLFLKKHFDQFCDATQIQEFSIAAGAKFESLKIFCILFYVSLVLYWVSLPAAIILSLINSVLFIGHFVAYLNWLDFLFPHKTSHNLIGVIEPKKEVQSTVIVSGHVDSAREFIWWWRLKQSGLVMTIVSGFLMGLFPFFLIIYELSIISGIHTLETGISILWWAFALASPITITMFNIHGKNVVPGAQDNLSGVAVATGVGRYFAENRLEHTRIKVLSYGSEEIGLRGSEAFAKTFKKELKAENAICLNLDGIKDADHLHIIKSEPMTLTNYTDSLIKKMEDSFNALNISYQKKPLPFGGTDGVSLIRKGIPALTIIGLSTEKLDPTYHTRLDVPECVDPKALEDTKNVLVHFIEQWDKEGG